MLRHRIVATSIVALALAAPAARAQDFSGSWDVAGVDPTLGAYSGRAEVARNGAGYDVSRIVEVAQKLPDGRTLAVSWAGAGKNENGGLRVAASLRRQDFISAAGGFTRGPQDRTPLALTVLLRDPSGAPIAVVSFGQSITGQFSAAGASGATETWTRIARVPVPVPLLERTRVATHAANPFLRSIFFLVFHGYHGLPEIAPFTSNPEFRAAVHYQTVDTTGRTFTRSHPDRVLVVQKVPDAIAVIEDSLRADAFRYRLFEKAARFDADMETIHLDPLTGMLGGIDLGSGTRHTSGDGALYEGNWVASQAWRFEATGDPQALANVERGTRALIMIVDAPNDPKQFARAVEDAKTANPAWPRSTSLAGVAWLPGGNNDMCHGLDYGFAMAERVLPAGHALLPEIGRRAKQLVENNKVAGGGTHALVLAGIAARLTGDPAVTKRYQKLVGWNLLERLWLMLGEGIFSIQGIGDWSGHHLGSCTLANMRLIGGAHPSFVEKTWRIMGDMGSRAAASHEAPVRPGLISVLGAASGGPTGQLAKDVLAEIPCPKPTGSATIDRTIDADFCYSPYPSLPWKADWMTNKGRQQSTTGATMFERGGTDNYWKENPYGEFRSGISSVRDPGQDFLHAYWLGRATGVFAPTD